MILTKRGSTVADTIQPDFLNQINNAAQGDATPATPASATPVPAVPMAPMPTDTSSVPQDNSPSTNIVQPDASTAVQPDKVTIDALPSKQPVLYDTQTRQPVKVPFSDVQAGIKSGAYSYKLGTKVNVVDPQGKSFNIDSSELHEALNQGFNIESPVQQAVREYVSDNKGLPGAAKVFLNQFANQASFGVTGVIQDHTSDDFERAKDQALKNDHQIANILGGVAGFGASLPLGAPLFKGATLAGDAAANAIANGLAKAGIKSGGESIAQNIVSKIAQSAGNLGVQGAVISAPAAITEATLGDPESAAESLLLGAGIGMGVGGLAHVLTSGASTIGKAINVDKLIGIADDLAENAAIRTIGFKKGDIERLAQQNSEYGGSRLNEIAKDLMDQGIVKSGKSLDDIANGIQAKKAEVGQALDDTINKLDMQMSVDPHLQQYAFNPTQVADVMQQKLIDPISQYATRSGEVKAAQDVIDSLKSLGNQPMSFADAIAKKNDIFGDLTANYKKLQPTEKDLIERKAYGIYVDAVENSAQKTFEAMGDQQGLASYIKNKNMMRNFIDLDKATASKQASELANRQFGLTDFLTLSGLLHVVDQIGPTALLGLAAKKIADKYGNAAVADYLPKITAIFKNSPQTANAGVLAAEQANRAVGLKLDKIKNFFTNNGQTTPTQMATSALSAFAGEQDRKMPSAEKLNKLNDILSNHLGNLQGSIDKISNITAPFAALGAPNIANAYQQKISSATQYLNSIIPKPLTPPNPFLKQDFKPSDSDIAKFERKLEVVHNPFVVLDKLKNGTLTSDEVEALQAVYPKIHQGIVDRITKEAMSPDSPPISYQQRLKLSLLFNTTLDPSLQQQNIAGLQATYGNQAQAASQSPSNQPLKVGQAKAIAKMPENYQTEIQKLMA